MGAARAQQRFPPLDFADDLAALGTMVVDAQGRLLAEPLIGLITPDFYDLYLERATDEGRPQLRSRAAQ